MLKSWSSTQPSIATSSAGAEFFAMVEGATRGLGLQTMMNELGMHIEMVNLCTDSASAKSLSSRRGAGKIRHIDVKELWLQEAVRKGQIRLFKVRGDRNPADILT